MVAQILIFEFKIRFHSLVNVLVIKERLFIGERASFDIAYFLFKILHYTHCEYNDQQ
jgi:hypothetical protein